jgi:pimeloyl-ACP methyl ester carboxylesterase
VYVEGGGNGKGIPMIFVHAGFQDHTMWDAQAKEFMKDNIVITLDLPGHGKTKDGDERPMAADVIRVVMDSLQIKKASLIGLSLGGAVITDFAIAHPERVNKMVLAAPGISGWDEGGREFDTTSKQYIKELTDALTRKDTAAAAEVFTHYWFDGIQRSTKTVSPLLRDLVYTTTRNTMRQHHASGWPQFNKPSAINRLAEIKMPILILTGTLDLPDLLLMNGYLANNLPNAKQVMVSGAAHMINIEKPVRFNEEVRRFLNEK